MTHLRDEGDHAGAGDLAVVLGLAAEREVGVLRPGEPEHRHLHAVGVIHAVPDLLIALVVMQCPAPMVLGVEEMSAAVSRDAEGETCVEPDDGAGDHPAPGDAHHADLVGVDFGQGTQERVRQHRVGEGVIHPLLLEREFRVGKGAIAGGSGEGVARPDGPAFGFLLLVDVGLAFDRDADGREALGVPFLDPLLVGRAAATVDEDDAGDFAFTFGGEANPGEHAGRLSFIGQGVVEDRPDLPVGFEAFGFEGLRGLGAGVHEAEDDFTVGVGLGAQRGDEEEAGEESHEINGRRGRCGSRRWLRRRAGRVRSCPCRGWDACP